MHIHRTTKFLSRLAGALLLAAFAISCKPNVDTPKTVKEITLTFNLAGGNINGKTDSVTVKGKYGEAVTKPAAPKRDGYDFGDWKPQLPETFPAKDTTYTAQWAKLHPVTFKAAALTATLDGKPFTGGDVAEGKIVEFTANDNDYAVENWTVAPKDALTEGGKPGESTAKVKITAATTVKVTFSPYKKVAFEKLDEYLKTANAASDGIYYIEVNGLTASDVKGVDWSSPSRLGMILKSNPSKKVALKLGAIAGLTDMSHCFPDCKNLTQVPMIPNGVTNMRYCFFRCENLTQAPVIPDKVTDMNSCFYGCTSLTQAPVIPSSVTDISYCFNGCTSLTQAPVIPSSVTDISYCFNGCTSLTQAPVIPSSVTDISYCFNGCTSLTQAPVIPSSVTDISYCFYSCTNLTQAPVIPNSVTNMNNCFYRCTSLTQAPVIPNGVTNMRYCFFRCENLTQAPVIPNSVTEMSSCFYSCTKLTSVTLKCNYPSSNPDAFEDAFGDCNSLTANSIKVPADQLQTYKNYASTMGTWTSAFVADN